MNDTLFAGRAWAYQRARLLLADHFQRAPDVENNRGGSPVLQASDFSPAVLDPRLVGVPAPEPRQQVSALPGGILPAGFQLIDLNPAGDLEVVGELSYWTTLETFRAEYGKNVVAVLEPFLDDQRPSVRVSLLR